MQLWLNKIHAPYLDSLFKYITLLGDGLFGVLLLPFFLLFANIRTTVFVIMGTSLPGLFTQILKRIFFAGEPRPTALLSDKHLHLVDGVHQLSANSFPSGHNTFTFALFTALAYIFRKYPALQIFFAIVAILTGYSRIYLQQHWVIDALVGQLIGMSGVLVSGLVLTYVIKKEWGREGTIAFIHSTVKSRF